MTDRNDIICRLLLHVSNRYEVRVFLEKSSASCALVYNLTTIVAFSHPCLMHLDLLSVLALSSRLFTNLSGMDSQVGYSEPLPNAFGENEDHY